MNKVLKSEVIVARSGAFVKITVCVALVLSLIGCAIPLSKKINGRWQQYEQEGQPVEPEGWFEFSPDHSVIVCFSGSGKSEDRIQGTYHFLNENHIVLDMDVSRDGRAEKNLSLTGKVSFTENGDLVLEMEDAPVTRWKRVE